jgi:signal peptidase II
MKKYLVPGILALVTVVLDFVTKQHIFSTMEYGTYSPVTPYFNIVHVHNTGAAFGILANAGDAVRIPFFIGVSLIAFGVIGFLIYKSTLDRMAYIAGLGLVLGGAIGNFIDRIRYGFVIDFLDFHWNGSHWPAFNVADIAISVGVGLLIIDMITEERKQKKAAAAPERS